MREYAMRTSKEMRKKRAKKKIEMERRNLRGERKK